MIAEERWIRRNNDLAYIDLAQVLRHFPEMPGDHDDVKSARNALSGKSRPT